VPAQPPTARQSGPGTARTVQQGTSQAGNKSNVPGNATRLYAIDEQVSDVEPSDIRGTILIQSSCARVLFDTGASLSVISYPFVVNLGIKPVDTGTIIQIETVTGSHSIPKHVCYKCPLLINDTLFEWDLVAIDMYG
ncbi:aspartyl protease family protein, partial [Klebsiella pneumoniae]|uniref:aspartyl protease family protein n=1 Tax=Klebsiella pneumoniae TaxID=573 RepID=UPI0019393F23